MNKTRSLTKKQQPRKKKAEIKRNPRVEKNNNRAEVFNREFQK